MFDAYRKWLGIPLKDQPPHHYRLLGLDLYESDPDVIEGAAERVMVFVRQYQSGEHAAIAAKLLNDIATARLCLLKPKSKSEYDATLRRHLSVIDLADQTDESESFDLPEPSPKRSKRKMSSPVQLWVALGIGLAVVVAGMVISTESGRTLPTNKQPPDLVKTNPEFGSGNSSRPSPSNGSLPSTPKASSAESQKTPLAPVTQFPAIQEASPTTITVVEKMEPKMPVDGQVILLVNLNSGRCLSVRKGYKVIQGPTPELSEDFERWKVVSTGDYFKLVNMKTAHVLAVPQSSKTAGVQLIEWKDGNVEDQHWTITTAGDNFKVLNRVTGFAVSVAYGSKDENAGVIQWPFSDTPDQSWRIERVDAPNK